MENHKGTHSSGEQVNARERVQNASDFIHHDACRIVDWSRGEGSILYDLQQDAYVAILESEYVSEERDIWLARSVMENALARHRERGYKTKMWQDSVEGRGL